MVCASASIEYYIFSIQIRRWWRVVKIPSLRWAITSLKRTHQIFGNLHIRRVARVLKDLNASVVEHFQGPTAFVRWCIILLENEPRNIEIVRITRTLQINFCFIPLVLLCRMVILRSILGAPRFIPLGVYSN